MYCEMYGKWVRQFYLRGNDTFPNRCKTTTISWWLKNQESLHKWAMRLLGPHGPYGPYGTYGPNGPMRPMGLIWAHGPSRNPTSPPSPPWVPGCTLDCHSLGTGWYQPHDKLGKHLLNKL